MLDRRSFFGAAVGSLATMLSFKVVEETPFRVKDRLLSCQTNWGEGEEDYWILSGYVEFEGNWDEVTATKELAFFNTPEGYARHYSHYEVNSSGTRVDIFCSFTPIFKAV